MKRMYYIYDEDDSYYYLNAASYGFSDIEELYSASNDIVTYKKHNLKLNMYVNFACETFKIVNNHLIIDGKPTMYSNNISDADRKQYDLEFDKSLVAYKNDDKDGINRWNDYLKEHEHKFMSFVKYDETD